jgi:hypothetical protein
MYTSQMHHGIVDAATTAGHGHVEALYDAVLVAEDVGSQRLISTRASKRGCYFQPSHYYLKVISMVCKLAPN